MLLSRSISFLVPLQHLGQGTIAMKPTLPDLTYPTSGLLPRSGFAELAVPSPTPVVPTCSICGHPQLKPTLAHYLMYSERFDATMKSL
jgi:hypothetical protein